MVSSFKHLLSLVVLAVLLGACGEEPRRAHRHDDDDDENVTDDAGAGSGSSQSGSGGQAGSGGGSPSKTSCTGPASTTGTVAGVTPNVEIGYVFPDRWGQVVRLSPHVDPSRGDVIVDLYLDDGVDGEFVDCAVLEVDGYLIDEGDCELHLTSQEPASSPGECDGEISASFVGVFYFDFDVLEGTFSLPIDVKGPGWVCTTKGDYCVQDDDCCSGSCWTGVGACE